MKFVILFRSVNSDQWVSSNSGNPSLKESRYDARQYNTLETATRRVRSLRKDGHERNGEFQVERIEYHPTETLDVPKPKPKVGFVLMQINTAGNPVYYAGHKAEAITSHKLRHFLNIERGSFFRDGHQADKRLFELRDYANTALNSRRSQYAALKNSAKGQYDSWMMRNNLKEIDTLEKIITELNDTQVVHIQ